MEEGAVTREDVKYFLRFTRDCVCDQLLKQRREKNRRRIDAAAAAEAAAAAASADARANDVIETFSEMQLNITK